MKIIDTSQPKWMLELGPDRIDQYSDEAVAEVLCRMPSAITFIKEPKIMWQRFVVQYSIMGISYIENPTVEIQRLSFESNSNSLQYMKSIDEDFAVEILMKKPELLRLMPDPTPMMVSIANLYA